MCIAAPHRLTLEPDHRCTATPVAHPVALLPQPLLAALRQEKHVNSKYVAQPDINRQPDKRVARSLCWGIHTVPRVKRKSQLVHWNSIPPELGRFTTSGFWTPSPHQGSGRLRAGPETTLLGASQEAPEAPGASQEAPPGREAPGGSRPFGSLPGGSRTCDGASQEPPRRLSGGSQKAPCYTVEKAAIFRDY
eukprot:gene7733-biopygen35